ncbi:MAG: hypothetical protein SGI84_14225 [Gemmatimonadota bacterium]|mgnify:CR=1 FL=1|nr:hypothetical protein [Gemmatimonadota bacterium]
MKLLPCLAALLLTLTGCKETLSIPTDCAVECATGMIIRDTVIDALVDGDSSFSGYLGFNEAPSLLLSNDPAIGIIHSILTFDVTPDSLEFGGTKFRVDIDSVKILVAIGTRDTLVSHPRLLFYRLPIRTDSTASFEDIESYFTPDRLIDSLILSDSVFSGEVSLLFAGEDLAKIAIPAVDSGRVSLGIKLHADTLTALRIGSRLTSGFAPGYVTYGTGEAGAPEVIKIQFDPEALYTGMVRSTASQGTPGPDLLSVGGTPASRGIVRFRLPETLRSQGNVLRATLILTPDEPIRGWALERTGLEVRPVVADLGYRSPPSSVAIGGALLTPGSSAEVEVDVAGVVNLWFQSPLIAQMFYLTVTTEGAAFSSPVFRSTRSSSGRPRLRLTYVLPGRPETP